LQITVLCIVLFGGDQIWGVPMRGPVHLTIIFNTFVFLQIWNEFNSRKVNGELNIFDKIFDNWIFTYVLVGTLIMQTLMVEVFGSFASTVRTLVFPPILSHRTSRVLCCTVNRSPCMKFSVHFKISSQ
jgi:hypothetical protein